MMDQKIKQGNPLTFNELLINEVRNHPQLYDQQHRVCTDNGERNAIWEIIAKRIDDAVTGEFAKKRWLQMRDRYRKELKMALRTHIQPKWPYFTKLSWLDPYLKDAKSIKTGTSPSNVNSGGLSQRNLMEIVKQDFSTLDPGFDILKKEPDNQFQLPQFQTVTLLETLMAASRELLGRQKDQLPVNQPIDGSHCRDQQKMLALGLGGAFCSPDSAIASTSEDGGEHQLQMVQRQPCDGNNDGYAEERAMVMDSTGDGLGLRGDQQSMVEQNLSLEFPLGNQSLCLPVPLASSSPVSHQHPLDIAALFCAASKSNILPIDQPQPNQLLSPSPSSTIVSHQQQQPNARTLANCIKRSFRNRLIAPYLTRPNPTTSNLAMRPLSSATTQFTNARLRSSNQREARRMEDQHRRQQKDNELDSASECSVGPDEAAGEQREKRNRTDANDTSIASGIFDQSALLHDRRQPIGDGDSLPTAQSPLLALPSAEQCIRMDWEHDEDLLFARMVVAQLKKLEAGERRNIKDRIYQWMARKVDQLEQRRQMDSGAHDHESNAAEEQ